MRTWSDSFVDSSGGAESRQPPISGPLAKASKGKALATRKPLQPPLLPSGPGGPIEAGPIPIRYTPPPRAQKRCRSPRPPQGAPWHGWARPLPARQHRGTDPIQTQPGRLRPWSGVGTLNPDPLAHVVTVEDHHELGGRAGPRG